MINFLCICIIKEVLKQVRAYTNFLFGMKSEIKVRLSNIHKFCALSIRLITLVTLIYMYVVTFILNYDISTNANLITVLLLHC